MGGGTDVPVTGTGVAGAAADPVGVDPEGLVPEDFPVGAGDVVGVEP